MIASSSRQVTQLIPLGLVQCLTVIVYYSLLYALYSGQRSSNPDVLGLSTTNPLLDADKQE
jgi:hypothetical protein